MRTRLAAPLALALLAPSCAPVVALERAERDRFVLRAIVPCEKQYPTVRVLGFDDQGRLQTETSPTNLEDLARFRACAQAAVKRELDVRSLGVGQFAASARPSNVPVQVVGTVILVPVLLRAARLASEAWYAEDAKGMVRERIVSSQGDRIDELVSYTVPRAP